MANSKLTDFTEDTAPLATDMVYVVHDPAGTPGDRKVKLSNLRLSSVDDPALWGADLGYDQEFNVNNSSSLPSGWAWVNQGSCTYLEQYGGGTIQGAAAAGVNWRCLTRSLASAPSSWLVTMKLGFTSRASNEQTAGMVLRESSSGKLLTWYFYSGATDNSTYLVQWSSATGSSSVIGGPVVAVPYDRPSYWRIRKNSSTSYDFEFSHDGVAWFQAIAAYDPTGTMTPNEIGFGGYNTTSTKFQISCHWARLR